MRPSIGMAALKLLQHAGCEVIVPRTQTCCGQPGYNAGDRASALALARKVMTEFESCDYIVVPSGSCAGMLRTHYPDVFRNEPAEREHVGRFCSKVYELTDFLCNVVACRRFDGKYSGTITYHDSCHALREAGVKAQPRELLKEVEGLTLTEMEEPEACCGFGGAFSVKFGDISAKLADDKCRQATATAADAIVTGDLGCMLHIEGRLRRCGDNRMKVLHVAEVLAAEANEQGGRLKGGA